MLLKMSETDLDLLRRYAREGAEDAFAALVRCHLDLVYSAALRQVRSRQLAEEVAQSAFTDLARQAPQLKPDTILTAWLYQVTRCTAIDVVRREARRQLREKVAAEMNAINATASDWTSIEPFLDEAMSALDVSDRAAILLRYFENKSLREVGQTLGVSDDAAQKRVSRAVEHLREFITKRGVTVGASGLAVVISANAVQAAPAGLAVTISTAAALAGTTFATAAAATTKTIAMTTLQKALIGAVLTAAVGAGIHQARQASHLRAQIRTLQQAPTPPPASTNEAALSVLRDKIGRLAAQNAELTSALAQANADNARLKMEREQARHSAALYKEVVEQANSKDTNPTNEYPSSRYVWAAFGRMGRLAALSKKDDSKLSPEEKSALEAAKTKALDDLPNLVKAAKYYDAAKPAGADTLTDDKLDEMACFFYGALNLDEQQFGEIYGAMQTIQQEAKQRGLSETNSPPEKAAAMNQMIEQFKTQTQSVLTPEQTGILADVLTHFHFDPGSSTFNFGFNF